MDFPVRGIVLAKFLEKKPDRQRFQYEYLIDESEGSENMKKSFSIDGQGLSENFTVDDVQQLIEIHKNVKRRFMENMIDIFAHPENHLTKTATEEVVPIKSIFRKDRKH